MKGYTMTEEMFDEFLDECYPVYKLGDNTFHPSQIFKGCDPIGYRIAFNDFENNAEED
jgi:hypothetical protein